MFRFDCTFSNFNCTKRVQLHTILRPDYMREADGATRRKVFAPITPDLEVFFLKD